MRALADKLPQMPELPRQVDRFEALESQDNETKVSIHDNAPH